MYVDGEVGGIDGEVDGEVDGGEVGDGWIDVLK